MTNNENVFDCVIVGAGPAGLQLGYMLQEMGWNFVVLERATPGSFFKKYPRHKKLLSINKVHTRVLEEEKRLRWDWNSLITLQPHKNMSSYTKRYFPESTDLVDYLEDFSTLLRGSVLTQRNVVDVSKKDDVFVVETEDGESFKSKTVVVATGLFKPHIPDFKGVSLSE